MARKCVHTLKIILLTPNRHTDKQTGFQWVSLYSHFEQIHILVAVNAYLIRRKSDRGWNRVRGEDNEPMIFFLLDSSSEVFSLWATVKDGKLIEKSNIDRRRINWHIWFNEANSVYNNFGGRKLYQIDRHVTAEWRSRSIRKLMCDMCANPCTYLFPHDISGLHDAARGKAVVSCQQDSLLQCHTQGAAVNQRQNIRSLN